MNITGHLAAEESDIFLSFFPLSPRTGGVVISRVEESYLWDCKQLGAYSPIVLLNTLLFFCTKTFHFTTLKQHKSLSFINFTRRSKPCSRAGKVHYLHYQRSSSATPSRDTGGWYTVKLQHIISEHQKLIRKITPYLKIDCVFGNTG